MHSALLDSLQQRFSRYPARHPGIAWPEVAARLLAAPDKLAALDWLEQSGGEPDLLLLGADTDTGTGTAAARYAYVDCAAESPKGRRSLCYDEPARLERKEHPPERSALGLAAQYGVSLLTPEQYQQLQRFGDFDLKTSSWLQTPAQMRALGGALFGDRRYGRVFLYHNGAQSYYAVRGFRALCWL
jgi:hypothetical protein